MSTLRVPLQTLGVTAALLVSMAAIAAGQHAKPETKDPPPSSPSPSAEPPRRGVRTGDVQKVFILKHLGLNDTARMLKVFPAEISGMDDGKTRVLSVSAAPAVVAAMEETLKRLDVPPPPARNVEVTAYVLECASSGEVAAAPADLQDVVAQLKRTFSYSGCGLARTLFTRASDNSRFRAQFREGGAGVYELNALLEVDATTPPVVRFRGLNIDNAGGPGGGHFSADIEVRDGQKVVLGRLGTMEAGRDQIVVLSAHLVP